MAATQRREGGTGERKDRKERSPREEKSAFVERVDVGCDGVASRVAAAQSLVDRDPHAGFLSGAFVGEPGLGLPPHDLADVVSG